MVIKSFRRTIFIKYFANLFIDIIYKINLFLIKSMIKNK